VLRRYPQVSYRERLVEFVKPLFVNNAEPTSDELFAWYCAHCAVIDQRVVELQLKHCSDDALRESVSSLFERVALVRDLLINRSNNVAAAIKRKLDVLLKQQDECSDAMQFAERVRLTRLDESDDIDAIAWNDVCVCFGALARARRQAHPVNAIDILMPLIQGVSEAVFTAEQQDALVRFYGKLGASACDTRARLGAVARDGDHVPYLVADEDRQRLVHVSRNVVDLRKALSSAVAATERASQWLDQSTALHCAGGSAELSLMAAVNESLFVNVRLFGVNLDSCSMAEAAECVTLMIGIRATMNVTAMNERIGEALLGDGVRARLDATLSTNAGTTITAAVPPPAPSAVPSARVWRQFGARDVTRGEILTDRNERVVARAASGDVGAESDVHWFEGGSATPARQGMNCACTSC
jgi:hypothetical protein